MKAAETLHDLLNRGGLAPPLGPDDAASAGATLERLAGGRVYPGSIAASDGALFFLSRGARGKSLGLLYREGNPVPAAFEGAAREVSAGGERFTLELCPTTPANAAALRRALPYAAPQPLGPARSFGFGDRLGVATPGHVRAARGAGMAPIFAQQSIREMTRTERTPQAVMDDATWGVFQEGWRQPWGADADHLKTTAGVDICVEAGYTFYTIDPGDHVDDEAATDSPAVLAEKVEGLPWGTLESSLSTLREAYVGQQFDLGTFELTFTEEQVLRAAAKYGRVIAHTVTLCRHLAGRMGDKPFELEMSVDETDTPTTAHEHLFVANELRRLGVRLVSLAPRYVGRFEKAVDYVGDLAAFEASLARHVAIARALGPYKLSLHSGSDKFSIYPIVARLAGDLVHVKTAGTSYLEALRVIAIADPALFREIVAFAFGRFDEDRATYHVSCDPRRVPPPDALADHELAAVLDTDDGRQLLHLTFGSVLRERDESGAHRFRHRLLAVLAEHEEAYCAALVTHFGKHLAPFQ